LSFVECANLCCGYHGRAVLRDINLTVERGEVVALLGPNGSGKSTFIKTLCRALQPLSGEVRLDEQSLGSFTDRALAQHIALVPQEESVVFPFTVCDVVMMGRLARSRTLRDTPEDHERARDAMSTADCLHLQDRVVTELSGGERQRVLLARALAQDSELLLLDEPTAHLDIRHQLEIASLLPKLASAGKALLVAVHDLNLAWLFAARVLLFDGSTIILDAPVQEAINNPVLDEVYGVEFRRVSMDDGRTILVASGPTYF
jgi:iron complex transport system ATP-binding protein